MRPSLAVLAAGAALLFSSSSPLHGADTVAAAPARPNVIFVLADDLGWAELGSYGQQKIRTPSIDRLAAEGVRFTQHYSGNAVCAPSRSVLLTGQHPGHTPIRDNRELQPEGQVPLPAAAVTLAELLKGQGYVTAAMGKWGLGPARLGGRPAPAGLRPLLRLQLPAPGAQLLPDVPLRRRPARRARQPGVLGAPEAAGRRRPADPKATPRSRHGSTRPTSSGSGPARSSARTEDRPFFLYRPDDRAPPRAPGARGLARRVPRPLARPAVPRRQRLPPAPVAARRLRGDGHAHGPGGRARCSTSSASWASTSARSSSSPRTTARPTTPRRLGLGVLPLVGPLRGLKGSLYEGGVRVPAIVRWTGRIPAGLVSERVTGFEDWLPTLLDLAGAREAIPSSGIDGLSFAPTLLGQAQEPRPFLYREFPGYGGQQSVRVGDWKGVRQGLEKPGRNAPRALRPEGRRRRDARRGGGAPRGGRAGWRRSSPASTSRRRRSRSRRSTGRRPATSSRGARRTTRSLLDAADSAWAKAQRITWGPEAIATSFRALWTSAGLAVRFDVTDASPWHTLTQRDERLWNEEVVELFLDVGSTGRSYAEVEWNPVNAVVDLWVDRAENRFDKDWNVAGSREPRPPEKGRRRARDRLDGRRLPAVDGALVEGAGRHGAAAEGGGSLALQRLPHRAPRRAEGAPEGRAVPGVVAHGKPQLPRPPRLPGARLRRDAERLASRAATRSPAPPLRLNIVSIVTDDQASWAMGAYGNPDARTPVLDRLAREGVVFRNAFVTTPVCSPSRVGFLTGRYGSELGITDWISPEEGAAGLGLPPGTPTWPAILRANGWRTALVGKWHLGRGPRSHPSAFGIDDFFGFLDGGNTPMDPTLEVGGREQALKGSLPDLVTDEAIRFVTEGRDQPFALLLHFREPHTPYGPVPEADAAALRGVDPGIPDVRGLDREQVKTWTREYLASVHSIDRNVGRLLEALDRLGLRDRTVVLFTSDNGYNIGHHALHTKGNGHWIAGGVTGPPRPNMFDTSLRVPLVVRGTGHPVRAGGRRGGDPARHAALGPGPARRAATDRPRPARERLLAAPARRDGALARHGVRRVRHAPLHARPHADDPHRAPQARALSRDELPGRAVRSLGGPGRDAQPLPERQPPAPSAWISRRGSPSGGKAWGSSRPCHPEELRLAGDGGAAPSTTGSRRARGIRRRRVGGPLVARHGWSSSG